MRQTTCLWFMNTASPAQDLQLGPGEHPQHRDYGRMPFPRSTLRLFPAVRPPRTTTAPEQLAVGPRRLEPPFPSAVSPMIRAEPPIVPTSREALTHPSPPVTSTPAGAGAGRPEGCSRNLLLQVNGGVLAYQPTRHVTLSTRSEYHGPSGTACSTELGRARRPVHGGGAPRRRDAISG